MDTLGAETPHRLPLIYLGHLDVMLLYCVVGCCAVTVAVAFQIYMYTRIFTVNLKIQSNFRSSQRAKTVRNIPRKNMNRINNDLGCPPTSSQSSTNRNYGFHL